MSAECTSIIIDGSHSLINDKKFDQILKYIEFILIEKLKKSRKTDWISLFLSNSTITENSHSIDDIVSICSCEAPVTSKVLVDSLTRLKDFNNVSKFHDFDADGHCILRTLLITNITIQEKFNKRKMLKQILIFGDNWDQLSLYDDEYTLVVDQLKGVKLVLVNCTDNFNKNDIENNTLWGKIFQDDDISHEIFHLNELMSLIKEPLIRTVKPVRTFSGQLRFGADIQTITSDNYVVKEQCFNDSNSICIQVEGFPAIKAVSNIGKKIMVRDETPSSYTMAKSVIEYEVKKNNENENGNGNGNEDISKEEEPNEQYISVSNKSITKGYRYGSEYVILPASLADEMHYLTMPGIDIRGFTDRDNLPRHYLTSEATFIMADTRIGTIADSTSFAALVDSMLKLNQFAIARYVSKRMSEVEMCVLVPHLISDRELPIKQEKNEDDDNIEVDDSNGEPIRALILTRLPFAEDERSFFLPRLVNRRTTSGKAMKSIDNESEIDSLMSKFIDSMDTDPLPCTPDELYFRKLVKSNPGDETTLPLPSKTLQRYIDDPLIMPSISINKTNQKIQDWVHQVLINKKGTLQVSEMSSKLRNKLEPYPRQVKSEDPELVKKLVGLLDLKKVEKQDFSPQKESHITYEKGKPIEELLKLEPDEAES